ncbi:hypothetical protein A2U01_0116010, partial [Trifolium medium]|nr:hypothetical protein [Trifolium medium]
DVSFMAKAVDFDLKSEGLTVMLNAFF